MVIQRKKYLKQLISLMGSEMIKVVTGMRRSGKSYLLFKLFYNYLIKQGVKEEQIIKINLDEKENIPGKGIGNMNSPWAGELLLTGEYFQHSVHLR